MNEVRTAMERSADAHAVELEPAPPTFGDAARYLWDRRVRLAKYFLGLLALGGVGTLVWSFARERVAEATLSLGFKGIEKGEYPNRQKFAVADVRGPKILQKAVKEIGMEKSFPAVDMVARGIQVQPLIPPEVLARWKKQDRDGTKREEYFPSNFLITARPIGMTPDESVQLLYALLQAYQQDAKDEPQGAIDVESKDI